MENKETSETLEEGSVEAKLSQTVEVKLSQTEILCTKILDEENLVYLNNLNEKCAADVYSLETEISHVELARQCGDGSVEESMVFDAIAGDNPQDKLSVLMCGDENDVEVLEGDLNCSDNNGIQIGKVNEETLDKCDAALHIHELLHVEKVDEPIEKGDHVLHPHEPGSPTKIEVSGNNINLFVDVFGPSNVASENSDDLDGIGENKFRERELNQEYPLGENGTMSPVFKEESGKNEGEDIVQFAFNSGDLVWVKTRAQSWWPGMISGTPNAANDTTKSEGRVSFLVKYYGNPSFVWCDHSELKPFVEYFEQMSGQNKNGCFSSSVERALCEIGQRVKSKMTCPCFTKESTQNEEENSLLAEKAIEFDVPSLSRFEPATFVACIKDLACSVHVQSKIELTVMKNRLSSFYCSIGHCELPLHLLKSEVNDGDNSNEVTEDDVTRTRRKKRNRGEDGDQRASSGKGWESRERKKSKYLSYPYVDVNQEKGDPKNPSSPNTKPALPSSSSGLKSQKGGTKKPLKGHHIISKADNIDACSSELLAEVCSAARDCFYLRESKYSDSLKRFYSSFRVFAFLDVDMACKDGGGQKEGVKVVKKSKKQKANLASAKESEENIAGGKSLNTDNQPAKEKVKKRAKKKKEEATNSHREKEVATISQKEMEGIGVVKELEDNVVGDKFAKPDKPQAKGNVVRSNAKKKKERVISAGLGSIQNYPNMVTNIFPNTSGIISFGQTCSNVSKSGTIPGLADINSIAGLPDLNGTHPSFSVEHIAVGEPSTNLAKPVPDQGKEGLVPPNIDGINHLVFTPISSSKSIPVTLQNTRNGTNQCLSEDFTARELGPYVMNTGLGPFAHYALKMGVFGSAGKTEPKKRKRKEKTVQPPSTIPDLNGNVSDMSSPGNIMPEESHVSPISEPPKKRVNKSDLGPNGEPIGGNLVLNFAPGSTLPSKETLVATFSRFGLLKESELQVLSDFEILIAYERRSDARFAFRSMEKSHPFGESLISFKTDCMPLPSVKKKKDVEMLRSFVPLGATASKSRPKPTGTPDIAVIKQNVEMMKLTLEKAGDNLSPEMRAKLENEIKAFLDKISSISGSSSS